MTTEHKRGAERQSKHTSARGGSDTQDTAQTGTQVEMTLLIQKKTDRRPAPQNIREPPNDKRNRSGLDKMKANNILPRQLHR